MKSSRVVICLHPTHCCCPSCTREFAEYFERVRELDRLAAADPEPHARDEFDAWVSQDPPVTCPEVP